MKNRSIFMENYVVKKFSKEIEYEYNLLDVPPEKLTTKMFANRLSNLLKLWEFAEPLPKIYYHF